MNTLNTHTHKEVRCGLKNLTNKPYERADWKVCDFPWPLEYTYTHLVTPRILCRMELIAHIYFFTEGIIVTGYDAVNLLELIAMLSISSISLSCIKSQV